MRGPYAGHPYFVTGHALFNAIARRVDRDAVREQLQVSHGVFVPGEYGEFPAAHSQDGYAGKLGQSLPPVDAYEDLFVFRDAAQRWLLGSRPRDAHNALDVQQYGGRQVFAEECWFGKPEGQRNRRRSMQWYVHAYLHDDGADEVVPLSEDVLDGLRVGAARNYGFGELALQDTQVVDLDDLDVSRLEAAQTSDEGFRIELLSPYVLSSTVPGADEQAVPWWWDTQAVHTGRVESAGREGGGDGVRRRDTRLAVGEELHELEVVDHGQIMEYAGRDPVATATNGVLRVGTHAKYGFGELRVRPRSANRVLARDTAAAQRGGES